MRYITNYYVSRYRVSAASNLNWSVEDLWQQVRIQLWKGIATFDSSKNFKIETYLSSILEKYFASLAKRCRSAKKNRIFHLEDFVKKDIEDEIPFQDDILNSHPSAKLDRPDDIAHKNSSVSRFIEKLTDLEREVLQEHVVKGRSIPEIARSMSLPRNQITKTVKSLRIELKHHIRRDEDDGDNI